MSDEIKTDNKISTALQDHSGGVSSMRVLMLVWGIGVFAIWAFGSVLAFLKGTNSFPTIPPDVVTVLLGTTSIKAVQRFAETK